MPTICRQGFHPHPARDPGHERPWGVVAIAAPTSAALAFVSLVVTSVAMATA